MLSDAAAERVVVAGAYKNPDIFLDVDYLLQDNTFTDPINQIVWSLVKSLRDENLNSRIDLSLLRSRARELSLDHIVEPELTYIEQALNISVEEANVRRYAAIIRNLEIDRLIYDQLREKEKEVLELKGTEGAAYSLNLLENMVFDLSTLLQSGTEQSIVHVSEGADEYFQYLVDNGPRDIIGISTGFPILDYILGGTRRKTVNVFGARSNVGKSFLGDNIALHVAGITKIPILFLDTEMDLAGHWHRIWAHASGVPSKVIETGKFSKDEVEMKKVLDGKNYINSIPYYYSNIAGKPFEETLAFIRRWLIKEVGYDENGKLRDCLIIYDYLKLMSGENIKNDMKEFQILGFQMTSLHNFAVKFDVPIIAFVQLNRDGIDKDSSDTISQSDRIVWLASSVCLYKPKSAEEIASSGKEGNRKLIVIKNRYGEVNNPNEYINMKFDGSIGRITEGKLSKDVSCTTAAVKRKKEFETTDGKGEKTNFKRPTKKLVRSEAGSTS